MPPGPRSSTSLAWLLKQRTFVCESVWNQQHRRLSLPTVKWSNQEWPQIYSTQLVQLFSSSSWGSTVIYGTLTLVRFHTGLPNSCWSYMYGRKKDGWLLGIVYWVFSGKSLPLQRTSHEFWLFNSFSTDFFSVGYGYNLLHLFWNFLLRLQEVLYTIMRVLVISQNMFNSKRFIFFYQRMSCQTKSEAPLWDIENL